MILYTERRHADRAYGGGVDHRRQCAAGMANMADAGSRRYFPQDDVDADRGASPVGGLRVHAGDIVIILAHAIAAALAATLTVLKLRFG